MIRLTTKRLIRCSDKPGTQSVRRLRTPPLSAGPCKTLLFGLFSIMLAGSAQASIPAAESYDDTDVLLTITDTVAAASYNTFEDDVESRVRELIALHRETDDPRFLGYAKSALQNSEESGTSEDLIVLSAIVDQSLHDFDSARTKLTDIVASSESRTNYLQALTVLINLEIVSGRYEKAGQLCAQLSKTDHPYIRANCQAQIKALTGDPVQAYQTLSSQAQRMPATHPYAAFIQNTLGDIASQAVLPDAPAHYSRALVIDPTDLYARTALADWHLASGNFDRVESLTRQYDDVDRLAVLRAIAQKRQGLTQTNLMETLKQRFDEAAWRDSSLHSRDLARYLLDVSDAPQAALTFAYNNWADQKELIDTRLLIRAAKAASDEAITEEVTAWMEKQGQHDTQIKDVL